MFDENMTRILQEAVNEMLVWVGFGTLVGLAAKAIMPGKDPGGAVSTMLMGIGGSVVGCGTLMFFWDGARVTPISSIGFLAATGGAFILLFFYRMLSGSFFTEAEDGERWLHRRRRRRRARDLADETY
ncbi:GlsB/YeaQ/YmgE family stress response membrane protein [Gimesia chilikensis]|jgi:uncharacterized membrane protein YeaQ/YmgE (transglycosylase-associated protein family)|uniref:GlsB/YeaQ/YmgE family stress response membrane protein n=1 Tax=Gimesia chilikensis TaxID=2605989 RepID=UPI000C4B527C|nr:GlsB/YeaQ/YmgE family stress response membrane protein [Gimesia chilikensis]KAA0132955.1 GlsB/YeaQ/YmgE family stress response membrane protein [Gimesia chilikensis]MBN68107.1 transglycosylase [Gimesia sp.]QDT85864.1 hypothetical protein MalM14_35340 [Gimesia chilikensis]